MTTPLEVIGSEGNAEPEAVLAGVRKIEGRSLGQIAWMRLKRDKVALAGGIVVLLLILMSVFAPLIVKLLGHPPNEFNYKVVNPDTQVPIGPRGGISRDYLFGVEPVNGRDLFSRIMYGSQVSLLIAFLATLVSVGIGTVMGVVAGYFGGWIDTVISRAMDLFLAFPILLFALALAGVIPDTAFGLSGDTLRIAVIVFIIGFFNWPYVGRIIRGQTLSLREREFVDAARSLGARPPYILARELLPNLAGPILVYSTLLIPTNILFEAALSFFGVSVRPPRATWGGMISDAISFYQTDPEFLIP
ncbi:MAG: peptide/nickel transport system permease protein, partial [Actinomycetota bacterium]|nr:peptide/nickel transport system permease protein [Actinomycetota bacterium]